MKIRAQIDKHMDQCNETLKVYFTSPKGIAATALFKETKIALDFFTQLFDTRLEMLNRTIIAEGGFRDNLTPDQEDLFNKAFDMLYTPDNNFIPPHSDIRSNCSFQLSKETATGEAITIELSEFTDQDNLAQSFSEAIACLNLRMQSVNNRVLNHMQAMDAMPQETQMLLQMIFDVLFCRADAAMVANRLKGYIQAQEELANATAC